MVFVVECSKGDFTLDILTFHFILDILSFCKFIRTRQGSKYQGSIFVYLFFSIKYRDLIILSFRLTFRKI